MLREYQPGDDFDFSDFPEREWVAYVQPWLRDAATAIGNFRRCRLPKCRRAHACLGRRPDEEFTGGWKNFPPCVGTNEQQSEILREMRRASAERRRQMHAQGIEIDD